MSGTSSPITFGVELEFNVSKELINAEYHQQALSFLSAELARKTKLPIGSTCRCVGKNLCAGCLSVPQENRLTSKPITLYNDAAREVSASKGESMTLYDLYFIKKEDCVPAGCQDEYWGMEITTPIRKADEIAAGLPEIKQLISALSSMQCGIEIGDTTGLHVHIGTDKLTLRMLQKCVTLVSILELPLLQAIQPEYRREDSWGHADLILTNGTITTEPFKLDPAWQQAAVYKRQKSQVDAHVPLEARQSNAYCQKHGKQIEKFLDSVWTAPTLNDLGVGICAWGSERIGLALAPRGPAPYENNESTIEFRYAAMTFDHAYITLWVKIVSRIVEISRLEANEFSARVTNILQALSNWTELQPEACFADLVLALGFTPAQAKEWVPLMVAHRNDHDASVDESGCLIARNM
jgi:hypothetical protein